MPSTSSSRLNLPLIALWVVSVVVAGAGFWVQRAALAGQADFYASGSQEPLTLLTQQTNTELGGMLVIAGIIGVLIALATHARNRFAALQASADAAAIADSEFDVSADDDAYDDFTDADATAPAAEPTIAGPTAAEPTAAAAAAPVSEPTTPVADAPVVETTAAAPERDDSAPRA